MAKKIYFASDAHLGVPDRAQSLEREKKLVFWLEQCAADAQHIYLLGDLFDFWFEYKTVVPKGYTRLLGCLARITDSGVGVTMFKGNHDMWMFGYLTDEMNINIVSDELVMEHHGKKFYIHHGDGLGPGDNSYKLIRKVFRSPLCQWLFARLHPNFGIGLANYLSGRSRIANGKLDMVYHGEKEFLLQYCKSVLQHTYYDYFIFGHRHMPLNIDLGNGSRYLNTGDWVKDFTYVEFDGKEVALKKFECQ